MYEDKGLQPISDLFGTERYLSPKEGMPLNERACLVQYFCDELHAEPKPMGVRLAHYKLPELYALKSAFNDRKTRNGALTARKYFWWVTRTHKAAV